MRYILVILSVFIALSVDAKPKGQGDGWPWPWGSECPFPWTDVEGSWEVKSYKGEKRYDDHRFEFHVEDAADNGAKLLEVSHYDQKGELYAIGKGISEGNGRVISAIMDPIDIDRRSYKIMVRAYIKNPKSGEKIQLNNCPRGDSVLAITICPLNGKKCMETANYTLIRDATQL